VPRFRDAPGFLDAERRAVSRLYASLCAAESRVAATFLVVMVLLIFGGGLARLVGHPQNWTIDAATCLFAWACFLSADVAWRRGKLMSVDVLVARLPEGARRPLRLLNCAIVALFLLYAIGAGSWLAWTSRARSFQGIPGVSYSWITLSMPVGSALLLLTTLLKIRDERRSRVASTEPPSAGAEP
jgi:TRAP-type C4-dicarboxylate transport system permease small subunit